MGSLCVVVHVCVCACVCEGERVRESNREIEWVVVGWWCPEPRKATRQTDFEFRLCVGVLQWVLL